MAIAKQYRPDIVILDIGMPELNGLEATRQIRKALPNTRVLMLSMHDEPEIIADTLAAGAAGYVLKSDAQQDLIAAVKALANRGTFFTALATEAMLHGNSKPSRRREKLALTTRESEILQLLAEGKSNKEIAGVLGISQRTVENHRANIMHKLRLRSFSELVRYAIGRKIIEA